MTAKSGSTHRRPRLRSAFALLLALTAILAVTPSTALASPPPPTNVQATAGVKQVALSWTAPTGTGSSELTGYEILRGGSRLGTTDAYTTDYLDTGVSAGTAYQYTVEALYSDGTNAASSASTTTPSTATTISQCSASPLPSGHYVLGADLAAAPGLPCLQFGGTANETNTTLDCAHHVILANGAMAVSVTDTTGFFVVNCDVIVPSGTPSSSGVALQITSSATGLVANDEFQTQGGVAQVATTTTNAVAVQNDTFFNGTLQQLSGTNDYVGGNVFTLPDQALYGELMQLESGSANTVDANVIDGGAPQSGPYGAGHAGADDGITIGYQSGGESGDTFVNNDISSVWDCGIETLGSFTNATILSNQFDENFANALCSYWWSSWQGNTVALNRTYYSPTLLDFGGGGIPSGQTVSYFQNNTFTGNALSNQTPAPSGFSPTSLYISAPSPMIASGNAFSGNDLGGPSPIISPTSLVSSSTNNACTLPSPDLTCTASPTTIAAPAPTVSGVSPAQGPIAGGTTVAISGTDFTNASAVYFGSSHATSVTHLSDTQLTAVAPAGPSGGGAVNVTVVTPSGTSPTSANDQFVYGGPSASAITPTAGPGIGGTTVTVTGSGFTSDGGVRAVLIDGNAEAPATVKSDTTLTFVTPPYTLDSNNTQVSLGLVTNGTAGQPFGLAASITPSFTYEVPTITNVNPVEGAIAGGTSVTLQGAGFAGATSVKFGGVSAQFSVVNDNDMTAVAPPGTPTTGTVDIVITTPNGTSPIGQADNYTYGPAVTAISPNSGPAGTTVTVTGTGFESDGGVNSVEMAYGQTAVPVDLISDTTFTFVVPARSGKSYTFNPIAISPGGPNESGAAVTMPTFTYTPAVSSVSPQYGPVAGGTSVTIGGSGFTNASAVDFGSTAESSCSTSSEPCFTVNSDSSITAQSPPGSDSTGYVDVRVVTGGQTSAVTTADQFIYGPTITGMSPSSGPAEGGTTVTVTGTGFLSDGGITTATMYVGASSAPVTPKNVTDTSFTFVTPPNPGHKAGNATLQIATWGSTSQANIAYANGSFTYLPPVVSSVSPQYGPVAGGTSVTIGGSGFTGASLVDFGSATESSCSTSSEPCFTVNSDGSITAQSPGGSDSTGYVDVRVQDYGLLSATSTADQFIYGPTITGMSPSSGPAEGGTTVTVTGTGFLSDGGITTATMYVGASSAPVTPKNVTDTSFTFVTPPNPGHKAGNATLQIATWGSTSQANIAYANGSFTYLPPVVSSVSPNSGPAAGGTSVTITGSGFTGAAQVQFGSTAESSCSTSSEPCFTVNSDSSITAQSPPGSVGTVDVRVLNAGLTSATSTGDQFTYK